MHVLDSHCVFQPYVPLALSISRAKKEKKKFNILYTAKVVSGYGRLVSTLFKVCPIARIYPIKELLDQTSHQPLFLSSVLVIRMGKGVDSIHRVGSIS